MYAKWTMAPSGYYVAVLEYNNGHYYSYGRNADHLEKNIKTQMYQKCRISNAMVHLEHQMSDSIDMRYASEKFMTRYYKKRINGPVVHVPLPPLESYNPQVIEAKLQEKIKENEVETKEKEYVTDIDTEKNEMIVYELKEVARYKLRKNALDKA